MKKFYYLFKVSVEKIFKELKRYKFNTISDLILFYVLFMAMFLGIQGFGTSLGVSSADMGDSLEGFIIGYFLWTVMIMSFVDIAYNVIDDANKGTLEQLNMSNINLSQILVVRSMANLLVNVLLSIVLLFIIMYTTNKWIELKILSIVIPIFIGIFSILGIGLICGGLALIFKKIQSLLNLAQFFLIGLVTVFPKSKFISGLIPFNYVAGKIFFIVLGGNSFVDLSVLDYGIMIGNSIFYFAIGLLVFNQCVKIAKKKGLLGQY
ncbi:MAG: hypothetical protein KZY61_10395 [Clostridiaceae bacterium]|nr:hypothetical protein [Clostridiaceae bacterium]MBW4860702.1 hypothetical protein [Clostridiaceae bacterium]MBW4869044.1 hypothetical protein [Clostridiaceae bacterium]